MFEVPKETQSNKDDTTENENGTSIPLNTNNENKVTDNRDGTNWSYEPLAVNYPSLSNTMDANSINF